MHESWVANFGIGEVMIQLFSLSDSERLAEVRVMQSVADWPRAMLPLWPLPTMPYNWPPELVIGDPGFDFLSVDGINQARPATTPHNSTQFARR